LKRDNSLQHQLQLKENLTPASILLRGHPKSPKSSETWNAGTIFYHASSFCSGFL
jgi:hypothetical protein